MKVIFKKKFRNSYQVVIGQNLKVGLDQRKKYVIITDTNLKKTAKMSFRRIPIICFKAGEENKNLETFSVLTKKLFALGIDRKSVIISFGGGVVGDIAGYVAGTYMRGIDYVQIPTTLLAMVDSSIGGKVAVDICSGKNISGLFYHPTKVIIDINHLSTLPSKQIKNGLVEVIKCGIIKDKKLFFYLKKNLSKILNQDKKALLKVIKRSCHIKAAIVNKDEKESRLRMLLNLGHTIGHVIEVLSNYKIPHGEAVAQGIIYESRISNKLNLLSDSELSNIEGVMGMLGFETKLKINTDKAFSLMKNDKKAFNNKIRFVLPRSIGNAIIKDNVPERIIKQVLAQQ